MSPRAGAPFLRLAGGLAVCAGLAFGCALSVAVPSQAPARWPDLLLVTLDTLRADHTSLHGHVRDTTPGLLRLAGAGVRVELAYAPSATTAPSHATLFTGLSPLTHGVLSNDTALPSELGTLAELLRSHGYRTGAFVSSWVLRRGRGFSQGFGVYDDGGLGGADGAPRLAGITAPVTPRALGRRAAQTVDRAIAWVRELGPGRREPLFVWVHLFDPHEPYVPPASCGDPFGYGQAAPGSPEQVRLLYDTEILCADAELLRLVATLEDAALEAGLLSLVTADHGEEFLEHGWRSHGVHLYEESVRIPLLLRWPGRLPAGEVRAGPMTLQDVRPTLLALMGIEDVGSHPRRSRLGESRGVDRSQEILRGRSSQRPSPVFFVRRHYARPGVLEPIPLAELGGATFGQGVRVRGPQYGLRWGRWKFLEARQQERPRELYDLREDPAEQRNLVSQRPQLAERLSRMLRDWVGRDTRVPAPASLTEAERRQLEALGYTEPRPEGP